MSSVIGILFDDVVKIGTDTYAHQPYQLGDVYVRHHNFCSKIFQLPQLRSVFASTGSQLLGNLFYEFVQTRLVGKDINCLLNIDPKVFREFVISRQVTQVFGHIYAYGFDFITGKFCGSYLYFSTEEAEWSWHNLTSNSGSGDPHYVVNPPVDDLFCKLERDYPDKDLTADEFVVAAIRLQRHEDLARDLGTQVGIGGEIILTTLGFNSSGNFVIGTEIVYVFPDKDQIGELMLGPVALS
ncbi:hypothetical protein [Dyadobacter sp. 22481]|uniref:hypothetical protein n=1 Tax=Dyadobacter sp. 22481 TaxID=3453926 RepID=UPI003F86EE78